MSPIEPVVLAAVAEKLNRLGLNYDVGHTHWDYVYQEHIWHITGITNYLT
jgi:hypothetical protein